MLTPKKKRNGFLNSVLFQKTCSGFNESTRNLQAVSLKTEIEVTFNTENSLKIVNSLNEFLS